MPKKSPISLHKPRELRRRVLIPAQVRVDGVWSAAHILNLSSRGMMIRTLGPIDKGTELQIRQSDQLINATVMWRHGTCAGLKVVERIAVEQIMSESGDPALQLTASAPAQGERARRRPPVEARIRARFVQFAALTLFAATLAGLAAVTAQKAMAQPFAAVQAALDG